jgi:hypothetical protein
VLTFPSSACPLRLLRCPLPDLNASSRRKSKYRYIPGPT